MMSSSSGSSQPSEQQSSRPNSSPPLAEDHIDLFLDKYDPQKSSKLAQTVVERFKAHAPTDSLGDSIKYQISSRGKATDSLRKNIRREKNVETHEELLRASCLRDLAGVRILTYFPDDVPAVAEHIASHFDLIGKPIVKYSKRSILDPNSPNKESAEDRESANLVFNNYAKGIWRQTNAEDIVRDWKHAGFRSVLFYVDGSDPKKSKHDLSTEPTPAVWERTVEIQITTIVMHAWSEVEHDLIYKNPYQLPPDPTIDRMVDAVNGLAITNEILLQQLQETFQKSRRTEEEVFDGRDDLTAWIFQHCLGVGAQDKYFALRRQSLVHVIVELLRSPHYQSKVLTRRKVRSMIQERAESYPDQDKSMQTPKRVHLEQRDGFHLLRKLLRNEPNSIKADLSKQSPDMQRLQKFLLASSMYSIWYGISSWSRFFIDGMLSPPSSSRCEENSPESVFPCIEDINMILVGKVHYPSVSSSRLEVLDAFCEVFLSCTCCDDHEVATKLARLSVLLFVRRGELKDYYGAKSIDTDHNFSESCERADGRLITPANPIDFGFLLRDFNEYVPIYRPKNDAFVEREKTRIPLLDCHGGNRIVSWWCDYMRMGAMDFQERILEHYPVAEFCWIEPENVNTYLGFILGEKRPEIEGDEIPSGYEVDLWNKLGTRPHLNVSG